MKRIFCLALVLLFFSACSVQEKISPMIFIERIINSNDKISADTENSFTENNRYVCFIKYSDKTDMVYQIETDEQGNATKISLTCTQTDKADDFIDCALATVSVYSPDDKTDEVSDALFNGYKLSDECLYFETQWHLYSAVISKNGLFFSVQSKKLIPPSKVEFSLKQNDIIEY